MSSAIMETEPVELLGASKSPGAQGLFLRNLLLVPPPQLLDSYPSSSVRTQHCR
jgi:hypothetical protein